MGIDMNIRIGTIDDIEAVYRLWKLSVKELYPSETPNKEWWVSTTLNCMNSELYFLFVLEVDEKVVGFVDIFILPEPMTSKYVLVFRHIFIEDEYRKGIIPALLYRKAIQTAKRIGATSISLTCEPLEAMKWKSKGYTISNIVLTKDI